jgi:hypothetical protein
MFDTGPAADPWRERATFRMTKDTPATKHRQNTISPAKLNRNTFAEPDSFPSLTRLMPLG